jgi:hypothetical protein
MARGRTATVEQSGEVLMTELKAPMESSQYDPAGELANEVAQEYRRRETSGGQAFWAATRPGGWLARAVLDAGETEGHGLPEPDGAVVAHLPANLAAHWDHGDLLRD